MVELVLPLETPEWIGSAGFDVHVADLQEVRDPQGKLSLPMKGRFISYGGPLYFRFWKN